MADPELPNGDDETAELPDEDLDFEIAFYEQILERLPDSIDVLMALGNDYTQCGFHEKGLAVDQRLCQLRQGDPIIHYNLACSCSLLGQVDKALDALEHAIAFGYQDLDYMQRDPDLEKVRHDPRYLALMERALRKQLTG